MAKDSYDEAVDRYCDAIYEKWLSNDESNQDRLKAAYGDVYVVQRDLSGKIIKIKKDCLLYGMKPSQYAWCYYILKVDNHYFFDNRPGLNPLYYGNYFQYAYNFFYEEKKKMIDDPESYKKRDIFGIAFMGTDKIFHLHLIDYENPSIEDIEKDIENFSKEFYKP